MKNAHEEIRKENLRIGGIVQIPELVDKIKESMPGATQADIHKMLLDWRKQNRILLQLANDRHLLQREKDGIESPRGVLYYAVMNPESDWVKS